MLRRQFIRISSLAGLTLTTLSDFSCSPKPTGPEEQAGENFPLSELTIDELQQKMSSGEMTSRKITDLYLKRIADIDKAGPKLNSVIELNPDATAIADAMDAERASGKMRGPLHGIPILIKDNIDTADKMMTTAGASALEGNIAAKDAFIVGRLREAGAVLLGKTNLSEWANFRSTRSASGWSSRGGQTRNPYSLDRNPCGSSSGTGTAVAANLCAIGIGTETNGSVNCPASVNGIVGIKPTVGLWSRSGIIPISITQDTAGPMTRTVEDAAILLGILAGADERDAATASSKPQDYTRFLQADALKGKRIGVEKSFLKAHEGVDALLKNAMDLMTSKGATFVEVDLMNPVKTVDKEEFDVLKYEFKDGVNKYLSGANAKVKSLKEVIEFNKQHESTAMPYFKQEILESSESLGGLDSNEYKEELAKLLKVVRGTIDELIKKNSLDAICGPTDGPAWCTDPINGDAFTGYGFYSPAAIAGYPSISIPMGMVHGLPIGLCFIGPAWSEGSLISIGYAYEQSSKLRSAPQFRLTVA